MKLFGTMEVKNNELYLGNIRAVSLAKEFGTPLYVFDEQLIRDNCRTYLKAFCGSGNNNRVVYAGKAFLTLAMCQLINQEGLCLDVVSGGELYTAHKANFPMDKIYFHGNNKTPDEIEMGINLNVGTFVADNFYEIEKINETAKKYNKVQRILLRVSPGIEAHTHDYIKTAMTDSKFGFTILHDETLNAVKEAVSYSNIELSGLHCHIGSQIFEIKPYEEEVKIMLELMDEIKKQTGCELSELNLGGGIGIYYTNGDTPRNFGDFCGTIINEVKNKCDELHYNVPRLVIEPGRSIVGNAGTTLYTIGSMKDIPDIRKYVSVDGGMADNIRPSLYNAEYECVNVEKVESDNKETVTISGKCCESGDILLSDVKIPKIKTGDILAVLTTGAYGYSMASNYNKIPRAAVVFVKDEKAKVVCRRETYEDLIEREKFL